MDETTSFRALHFQERPFLLPNAWDAGSAIAFAAAGFPAIGTTSFGVNASAGRPDAGGASKEATVALVRRLAALPVHLSADIEDGYSDDPQEVAAFVAGLGVAGINLEDSARGRLVDPALPAAKIAAIKEAAPDVFVNARVDSYWLQEDTALEAVVARAERYRDAGADGLFFPGEIEAAALEQLTASLALPINVLISPGVSLDDLARLGVRRVSTGSLPYRAAVDAAVGVAEAVRDGREPAVATSYAEAQQRLIDFEARTTTSA